MSNTEIITELLGKSTFTKSDKKMLWVWKIERKIEKEEKNKEKNGNIVVNGILLTMLPYKQKSSFFLTQGEIFLAKCLLAHFLQVNNEFCMSIFYFFSYNFYFAFTF